jgi:hypothetical protein
MIKWKLNLAMLATTFLLLVVTTPGQAVPLVTPPQPAQAESKVYLPLVEQDGAAPLAAPVIHHFVADPDTVATGGQTMLHWSVSGAASLRILPAPGAVIGTSIQITPTATSAYTLIALNAAGSVTATVMVTVVISPGDADANFFLPNQPDGNIVTTGLPKIALDAAGGVHVAYAGYMPEESSGLRRAYYGYCPDHCTSADQFTLISMGASLSHAQLALTPAGQPRLLLTLQTNHPINQYYYAECNQSCTDPAQWSLVEAATGRAPGAAVIEQDHTFALDAQGRPHFVYMADGFGEDPSNAGSFYVMCEADCTNVANWVRTKLSDHLWQNPTLAFSPNATNSQPRIAFGVIDYEKTRGWFGYFECNADCTTPSNWRGDWLAGTDPNWYVTGAVYALRIDRQGRPRIAIQPWQGFSDRLHLGQLSYMACDANCTHYENWMALDLGLPSMYGEGGVDLALDNQNRPRIAYRIPGVTRELAYAWCNDNCATEVAGWQTHTISTTAQAQQEWPFDPMQGCPSPTCIPPIPSCTSASWDAGYWPSLSLDAAGNPRIVFDLKSQHSGGGCPGWSFVRWARFVRFDQP